MSRPGRGTLWQALGTGSGGITTYNQMNKVEPMRRALEELHPKAWLAGLRRQQSSTRKRLNVLAVDQQVLKIHPIVDWTGKDVYGYLKNTTCPTILFGTKVTFPSEIPIPPAR